MRVPGFKITAAAETGPASGLIPASATPATALCPGPTEAFHSVAACEPLSFGPVFRAPLFNHRQDGARSRAAVSAQDFFEARLLTDYLFDPIEAYAVFPTGANAQERRQPLLIILPSPWELAVE